MSMTGRWRTAIAATALFMLAVAPSAARARAPSVQTMTVDYAQVLSGADSPCRSP